MAEGRPPRTQACDLVRIETTSGGQDDRFPLFRTGSGKSVTIKESSLRKAAAVLEGNGINKGDKITLDVGAKDEVFPMFSTGSGKLVTVKESSIRKAAAIFIGENMEKGSSKPSTTESSCCGRISTRYPFQLKRKNLKDFFGGPPTCQDLSGSLPHEVSNMDADNAVTYRFYDASHHDEIGLEAFQVMLLKSGMEAIVEDANLATPSSGSNILSSELNATQQPLLIAKEFAALKSTDDRLQVSFSDGDLRAFLDNQRSDVRQVGKFQPRNKSQPKKCSNRSPRGGRRIEKKLDFQRVWRILILSPNPKMFKNLSSGSMKEGLLQKMMKMMTLINHMDGSRSDDCHRDEDMPKPKRTKRKSKRQTNEIEKPTLKHKKAFEKPDYVVENSPKKKFPHATRRRRRQVLFLCPIMRTFFLERIKNNHSGEEANQNVQSTPKRLNYHSYMNRPQSSRWSKAETKLFYEVHRPVMKNDLEVVTKIQHRGGCRK
ncbi:BRCA2, helical [Musa troglodytarum]|uniref:BRCA2, helical n=1 Tax=Musa troglodytarum TaxID=320322 RepID=A0A9E7EQG3_9LILI|nr:BRCA2, helical [Musa troglodytarum]